MALSGSENRSQEQSISSDSLHPVDSQAGAALSVQPTTHNTRQTGEAEFLCQPFFAIV